MNVSATALSKTIVFLRSRNNNKKTFVHFHIPGLSVVRATQSFGELLTTAPGKAASGATCGSHPIVLITFLLSGFAPHILQICPQGGQQPDSTKKSRQRRACHAMELHLAELGVSAHPGMVPCPISMGYCSFPQSPHSHGPCGTAVSFPGCTKQARVGWQTPADNKKPCVTPARLPHHTELTTWRLSPRGAQPAGRDHSAQPRTCSPGAAPAPQRPGASPPTPAPPRP